MPDFILLLGVGKLAGGDIQGAKADSATELGGMAALLCWASLAGKEAEPS